MISCSTRCLSPQTKINVQHLRKLIEEGLSEHSGNRGTSQAGSRAARIADTVGKEGFSLKVNRDDTNGEVALFSISGGAQLIFPSRQKLNRCLPNHRAEVDAYMSWITSMGCDVDVRGENARPRLPLDQHLDAVLGEVDGLARCCEALAG